LGYLRRERGAVDVFGSRSNEIPTKSAGAWSSNSRGGVQREFAAVWRAEAKQVPRAAQGITLFASLTARLAGRAARSAPITTARANALDEAADHHYCTRAKRHIASAAL
jgi:hypothetical protein